MSTISAFLIPVALVYLLVVKLLRYRRRDDLQDSFRNSHRDLSSMTTQEAHDIMTQLQDLEFHTPWEKLARLPCSRLAVSPPRRSSSPSRARTHERPPPAARSTPRFSSARLSPARDSDRYMHAVARMNYLHVRYRKAGKILDDDLLHTLGSNVVEIFRILGGEDWRTLSEVERCAVGVFHRNLGEDLEIPLTPLPSSQAGWRDGLHFAEEFRDWTVQYEKEVAKPVATGDQYVRVYVDSATSAMSRAVTLFLRKSLGSNLDSTMRESLNLESPGVLLASYLWLWSSARKLFIRHLCLPRPSFQAFKAVHERANPETGLFNFDQAGFQPWCVAPTLWAKWRPSMILLRAIGARASGTAGDRYHPQGYDLKTIGPIPQEGKGLDEMRATVEFMRTRGTPRCPFSRGP